LHPLNGGRLNPKDHVIGCGAAKEGSPGRERKENANPDKRSCNASTQNQGEISVAAPQLRRRDYK
jgi:hypothetical protein